MFIVKLHRRCLMTSNKDQIRAEPSASAFGNNRDSGRGTYHGCEGSNLTRSWSGTRVTGAVAPRPGNADKVDFTHTKLNARIVIFKINVQFGASVIVDFGLKPSSGMSPIRKSWRTHEPALRRPTTLYLHFR